MPIFLSLVAASVSLALGPPATDWSASGRAGSSAAIELRVADQAGGGEPVPLTARVPDETSDAPRPVLVFSHGAGGSGDAFENLSAHLASHGWVVLHPTHADSIKRRRARGEQTDPALLKLEGQARRDALAREVISKVRLRDRLREVRAVLAALDTIEAQLRAETGDDTLTLDRDRLAMAGHSAGAMTTQALAGLRFYPERGRGSRVGIADPEPAFQAFVVISGQGTSRPALHEQSWRGLTRPMLVIGGSEDFTRVTNTTPEDRRDPFDHAPARGHTYLAFISGATHSSYQGKQSLAILGERPSADVDAIVRVTNASTLAFLEGHINQDADALAWLQAEGPSTIPGVETAWHVK